MVPLFDYMDVREQIQQLVDACLQEEAFADCFTIDLHCSRDGRVILYVDSDTGLTLARCQALSRSLEHKMDDLQLFDGKYVLEVSSPGADRPLAMKRQYPKHVGRTLAVRLRDGSKLEGVMAGVDGDTLQLIVPDGKREAQKDIPFGNIEESFVQISFKKRK
ncbi:MAG: hypothetical protein R3301_01645 [Saprospiraceae bacterium]|nr:hypothetical protein [Saprospiraceae bacterium]